MADFRYSLTQAPQARTDGSGCVDHQIIAEADENGGFIPMASRNKTFCLPSADLAVVIAMANGAAKVDAYKNLIVDNINTAPQPNTGWPKADLQAFVDDNAAAASAASDADEYITVTLEQSYPVSFMI